jgi:metal-sulfur cluster biosynthetic enzyme
MVTVDQVTEKLRECYDPEIPLNIVDLGLVYGVDVQEDEVRVRMTLTSSHCPLAGYLAENVRRKILEIDGVASADVQLVWDPPWSPERISREAKDALGV